MIPFNIPPCIGDEFSFLKQAIELRKISGDGQFTKKCSRWLEEKFQSQKILLTTSGTSALDMATLLCDFKPGDEVILPSYTFSSTATSAVLAGIVKNEGDGGLVFIDVRSDTMNIDETLIEDAITPRTKAIIVVHYAGVACEMDKILEIANRYNLKVIEDAAQGVMSRYKGKALGTIGDFGCYSFHETKNYSMGEGGAISINNSSYNERAEILREKGTNRSKFFRGEVDKYTWVDLGDSYLPSELNAAYLWAQLLKADHINEDRKRTWNIYFEEFQQLANEEKLQLPYIPKGCEHNAHMFYVKLRDLEERTKFIEFLKKNGVYAVFHYVPLHSSPAGLKFGRFHGEDRFTTKESERLVRLPLYYGLKQNELEYIIEIVKSFFKIGARGAL
ncbi:MAG: dTDP-4-amino-4,6-dideoxygalactose transaminase [Selenomonadaceae bacterium]|nr:dTDP-4-amino-4,6-dideoxygalactose transaminase [Selenomonadaceae bacterium]